MKMSLLAALAMTATLGPALMFTSSSVVAADAQPTAPLSVERTVLVGVTASVEAIDLAKRAVTLKGPLGNVITFTVDERVKRLGDFKVGDLVQAAYYVSVAGELRAATEAEKATPLVIVEGGARAPKDAAPAGGVLRVFKVVATVIGLDLPTQSFTLQGPLGNSGTIRAENVENLKRLHLGDTVVVTYTEALAVSLEKATP